MGKKKASGMVEVDFREEQGEGEWEEERVVKVEKKKPNKNGFAVYSFFPELFLNIMINKLKNPTPVQRKTLPLAMEGKDVVVSYKTGSGKTLSYLLPIINKLQSHSQIVGARALILIPTRDLADQITRVLKSFLHKIDLRYSLILGGFTYDGQFESLSINPDIIIATPGRLMQLLTETDLKLGRVQTIVFDEADKLFGESNFQNELKEILGKCPASQRLMFSATITPDLTDFALAGLRDYSYVHQEIALPETMKIDFFVIRPEEKAAALLYVLSNIVKNEKVIIFVSTRFHVDYLVALLGELHQCFGVYGKMDMEMRTYALDSFRKRRKALLVVTDVAARGLDIPEVNFVVHYDYPSDSQIFVHRSGRTARAEKSGHTIALMTYHEMPYLVELSSYVTKKLANQPNYVDCINYGTIPSVMLIEYVNLVSNLREKNSDIVQHEEMALKGFEKFKRCRAEASQSSLKKARSIPLEPHYTFTSGMEEEEKSFMNRVHKFVPKKSFLEMQKISLGHEVENDTFLTAIEKIRKEQGAKEKQLQKRETLRVKNASRWKEILDQKEVKEFEEYREEKNSERVPIKLVEGVEIDIQGRKKKKAMKDFRNLSQYVSTSKDPNSKSEFDDLPRIKTTDIDAMIQDENPVKRALKKRVWDKTKKNFAFTRDKEDKQFQGREGEGGLSEVEEEESFEYSEGGGNGG